MRCMRLGQGGGNTAEGEPHARRQALVVLPPGMIAGAVVTLPDDHREPSVRISRREAALRLQSVIVPPTPIPQRLRMAADNHGRTMPGVIGDRTAANDNGHRPDDLLISGMRVRVPHGSRRKSPE